MQVNRINQNTSFKSQFVPSKDLQRTFQIAIKQKNNIYAKSLDKLLNNGKNEIISFKPIFIRRNVYKGMDLCINGEPQFGILIEDKYLSSNNPRIHMALDIMALINSLANMPNKEFAECSIKEAIPKLRAAERKIFAKQNIK